MNSTLKQNHHQQKKHSRHEEREQLDSVLRGMLQSGGGSVYVYGVPGAGKTAVARRALAALEKDQDVRSLQVNCAKLVC